MKRFKFGNIQLDPWALGNLAPRNTGVDAVIWVSTYQEFPTPFILVGMDSDSLSSCDLLVAIDNPQILLYQIPDTVIPHFLWAQLVKWINLNFKGLLLLWNDEISTADFVLNYLQKI